MKMIYIRKQAPALMLIASVAIFFVANGGAA